MRGGTPDQVPVAPDISNYIPVKRTGRPFWEIYFEDAVPLWRAYLEAADHFGLDMWIASCAGIPVDADPVPGPEERLVFDEPRDAMIRERVWHTAEGTIEARDICFRNDPPTHLERPIKSIERDWPAFRELISVPQRLDRESVDEIRKEVRERDQAFGLGLGYPGFQQWEGAVEGSIEALSYAFMDTPHILDEWHEIDLERGTRLLEAFLTESPDYVLFGGSGTLTMASPELARRYALPAIKLWSRMCRDAGVATMLHSCGRSRELVDMLVEDTHVDCINPLEVVPMGDVDLAEVKRARGDRIALMGNLHTTAVMLHGTPEQVFDAACEAIRAAGSGGGFILSTGDQCPPGTPDENLIALHRAVEAEGHY